MLNLIDPDPMRPGWGRIWQSGEVAALVEHNEVPGPRMTVSLIWPIADFYAQAILGIRLADWRDAQGVYPTLQDNELLGHVDALIAYLSHGVNIIIHCLQGKSRSSYLDIAVHMRVLKQSYDQALGYVRRAHPIAQPNPGLEAQLRRLEPILTGRD